jgi:hypothetical protein
MPDPHLAQPDGQRHRLAAPGRAAALDASHDRRPVIAPHVDLGRLDVEVAEFAVPVDPLPLVEIG